MDDSRLSASVGTVTHTPPQKATRPPNPPQRRPVETRTLFAHGPRERLAPDPPLQPPPHHSHSRTELASPGLPPDRAPLVVWHYPPGDSPIVLSLTAQQLNIPRFPPCPQSTHDAPGPKTLTPHPHSTSLRPHSPKILPRCVFTPWTSHCLRFWLATSPLRHPPHLSPTQAPPLTILSHSTLPPLS
jgi:hypothetical protein